MRFRLFREILQRKCVFLAISARKLDLFSFPVTLSAMNNKQAAAADKAPCRLDNADIQAVLRLRIAETGNERAVYKGVCSERTFLRWKARNRKAWQAILDSGLKEFAARCRLSNPDLLAKAVSRLSQMIDNNEGKMSEIIQAIRLLLEIREDLNK